MIDAARGNVIGADKLPEPPAENADDEEVKLISKLGLSCAKLKLS